MQSTLRYIGLPYATWHKWRKENYFNAGKMFDFAHQCHLEAMADKTLQVFLQLEAKRESCMAEFKQKHDEWEKQMNERALDARAPVEPIYWGPSEWELSSAREKAKMWHTHLQAGLERFRKQQDITHNINSNQSVLHEVVIKKDKFPADALRAYHKLIEGKVD